MATAFQADAFENDAFQIDGGVTPPSIISGGSSIGRRGDLRHPFVQPELVGIHGVGRMPAFGAHGSISFEVFALMGIATGTRFMSAGTADITPPNVRMSGVAVADPFQSISQFTITMRRKR